MRFLIIAFISTILFAVNIDYYNQESLEVYNSIISREHSLLDIEAFFVEYPYSKTYLEALKSYYKLKMDLFNSFTSSETKDVATYAYVRELMTDQEKVSVENFSDQNISEKIYDQLKYNIAQSTFDANVEINHKSDKYKDMYDEEDVSIVLNAELSVPDQTKIRDVLDLNINYQIYLPSVYFDQPVVDIYIRESFVNSKDNYNRSIEKIKKELNKNYAWRDINFIIEYLSGSGTYREILIDRLDNNPDDYFAIKLLALSDWEYLQSKLLNANNAEGLIRANLMYPFSTDQSKSICQYAKNIYEIKTKIKLLSYLGSAGYDGLLFLLNEVLAEIDDIKLFELIGPVIYIAMENGDDETLEHLYLMKDLILDYDDEVEEIFSDLVNAAIKKLEGKYQ